MSSIITFVGNKSAARAVDEKTLVLKTTCGMTITINFGDYETMKSISDAILNADPATLPIDFDALALKDDESQSKEKDEEENHGKTEAVSGEDDDSETTKGAPPTPASAESSFDSYWGGGMTQEAHF